jgi:hypothetical protein
MYLLGFLTIVMHASNNNTERYRRLIPRAQGTWLRGVQHVIVHGGTGPGNLTKPSASFSDLSSVASRRRRLTAKEGGVFVSSPDNPGCAIEKSRGGTFVARSNCARTIKTPSIIQMYPGAHRTLVGLLAANNSFPNTSWTLVVDDDNLLRPAEVASYLSNFDPDVPFFLAGRLGPTRGKEHSWERPSCTMETSDLTTPFGWGCCYSHRKACRVPPADSSSHQYLYSFNYTSGTIAAPKVCTELNRWCCRSAPWPEGAPLGYPYRAHPFGPYRPSFLRMWPYGGAGYVLSRGMLRELGRGGLLECINKLQCGNADHRITQCLFNRGFSITHACRTPHGIGKCSPRDNAAIPSIMHHIYSRDKECVRTYVEETNGRGKRNVKIKCIPFNETWPATEDQSPSWRAFRSSPLGRTENGA